MRQIPRPTWRVEASTPRMPRRHSFMDPSPRFPERPESVFLRTMAAAPRTLPVSEPFDAVEGFLEHLSVHLRACVLTQALAAPINQLLDEAGKHRVTRGQLARIVFALEARRIFCDDELNRVLDEAKVALSADKSDAGVALYKDVFENKSPIDTRKYVLGPQLTTMTFWPGKMAGSPRPEVNDLGVQSKQVTDEATTLLNDIGTAETALSQFDTGPWATFIDACNAAVKRVFGQLSELEHAPPSQKGSLPGGFVDRFFLRDTSGRVTTQKALEDAVAQTKAKLARQEAQLKEMTDRLAKDQEEKLIRELKDRQSQASVAQAALDTAAGEVARLKAELEKNKPPPGGNT